MSPDVSVIIVTWNGRQFLEPCLMSVMAQTGVDFEIVVVDNGSTDGSAELVRAICPAARIVRLPTNDGFAAGNNAGAREARGRFLAFLNNDTVVEARWLQALRSGIDADAGYLLATSRIVYMHDPAIIDSAGDGVYRWGGAFKMHHGAPASQAETSREVFGICGAACIIASDLFRELDGFDAAFFASHEDVDLSYRARLLGYRCRYVSDAVVRHHGSATLGHASPFAVFHGQRNLEWMYLKNTPASLLFRTLPGHLLYDAAAGAYFATRGRFGTFVKAKAAALAGIPRVLRQRAAIQRTRVAETRAIERLLDTGWLSQKIGEKRFDVTMARINR